MLSAFAEQTVDIEVQGIRGFRAVRNTDLNVNLINKEEMDGSERYQHLVTKAVDRGLRVFGYYESSVRFERKQRQGKRDLLIAHVTPGEPTKIVGTDVQIEGKPHKMKILMRYVKTCRKKAFWFEHQTYDDYKTAISRLALNRGYFDGEFKISRLEISPETHQAWWRMLFDSGVRYHYGNITFSHSQIRDDYLNNILNIKSGDPYLMNNLSDLTSDFFHLQIGLIQF